MTVTEEITPDDKENIDHLCKDDGGGDWCTVNNKCKARKERTRFNTKMQPKLDIISEEVQEQQQSKIELVLRPQQLNVNSIENNNHNLMRALSDRNYQDIVRSPPDPHPRSSHCSFIDKLHQTLDKVSTRFSSAAAGVMFHDNSALMLRLDLFWLLLLINLNSV